jgi:DNA polymerase
MGGSEIFLDGLDRETALELLARAKTSPDALPAKKPAPQTQGGRSTAARPTPETGRDSVKRTKKPAAEKPLIRPLPTLPDDYDAVRGIALECTACGLAGGRTQVVFSDGSPTARLMVVGEAPGANEDETGVPFVGQAGKYLDLLLATVGLSREESVYIANVLKCRPPGNRDPLPGEIETCSPYLRKQIDLVKPEVLLAVGSFSGRLLTGSEKSALGKLRGTVHSYHGVPLIVTYHPAALLRNPNWTRAFWDDLQLLRGVLDGTQGA